MNHLKVRRSEFPVTFLGLGPQIATRLLTAWMADNFYYDYSRYSCRGLHEIGDDLYSHLQTVGGSLDHFHRACNELRIAHNFFGAYAPSTSYQASTTLKDWYQRDAWTFLNATDQLARLADSLDKVRTQLIDLFRDSSRRHQFLQAMVNMNFTHNLSAELVSERTLLPDSRLTVQQLVSVLKYLNWSVGRELHALFDSEDRESKQSQVQNMTQTNKLMVFIKENLQLPGVLSTQEIYDFLIKNSFENITDLDVLVDPDWSDLSGLNPKQRMKLKQSIQNAFPSSGPT